MVAHVADALCHAPGCIEPALYWCSWKDPACGAILCARHGRDTGTSTALCDVNPSGVTWEESHVRPRPLTSSGEMSRVASVALLATVGVSVLVGAALEGWRR